MDVSALEQAMRQQYPHLTIATVHVGPDEPVWLGAVHPFCELSSLEVWSGEKWQKAAYQLHVDDLPGSACKWIVVDPSREVRLFRAMYAVSTEMTLVGPEQAQASSMQAYRATQELRLRLASVGVRWLAAKELSDNSDCQYAWVTYLFVRELFEAMQRDRSGVEVFLERLQLQPENMLPGLLRDYTTAKDLPFAAMQYVAKWGLRLFLGLKNPGCSSEKGQFLKSIAGEPEAVGYVRKNQPPTAVLRRDHGQSEWRRLVASRDYQYRPDTSRQAMGNWLMIVAERPCSIRIVFGNNATLTRLMPVLPGDLSADEAERMCTFRQKMHDYWRLKSVGIYDNSGHIKALVEPPLLWRAYCLALSLYREGGAQREAFLTELQSMAGQWPADVRLLIEQQFGTVGLTDDAPSLVRFLRAAGLFLQLLVSRASKSQKQMDAPKRERSLDAKINEAVKKNVGSSPDRRRRRTPKK